MIEFNPHMLQKSEDLPKVDACIASAVLNGSLSGRDAEALAFAANERARWWGYDKVAVPEKIGGFTIYTWKPRADANCQVYVQSGRNVIACTRHDGQWFFRVMGAKKALGSKQRKALRAAA